MEESQQKLNQAISLTSFSKKTQEGLKTILRLAINNDYSSLHDIVYKENIPPMNLEKIISNFREKKLVKEKDDKYTLAVAPEKINLLTIIECLEGSVKITPCNEENCGEVDSCRIVFVWRALDKVFREKFKEITLKTLVDNYKEK